MIQIFPSNELTPHQIFEQPSAFDAERIGAIILVAIGILGLAAACLAFPMMEAEAICLALGGAGLILMAGAIASGPFYSDAAYRPRAAPFYYRSPGSYLPIQPVWYRRPLFVDRNWNTWNRQVIPLRSRCSFPEGNRVPVGRGHVFRNDWTGPSVRPNLMDNRVRVGSRR